MNYKNKIHETDMEIIWEIEEVVKLEENGIYNTTYLAESIIATAYLNNNTKVLVRYLYKEKKPEIVLKVKNIKIEYVTNYGVKTIEHKDVCDFTVSKSLINPNSCETEICFNFIERL